MSTSHNNALPVAALDYELPQELIATRPAEPRDAARLMVVRLSSGAVEHRHVRDLPSYLEAGDALVVNTSRVIPARLIGRRADTAGRVEGLYLETLGAGRWRVMLRSNGRLRAGQRIELLNADDQPDDVMLDLIERAGESWVVKVCNARESSEDLEILARVGRTPLPPYILRARGEAAMTADIADSDDRQWYQTVYAAEQAAGSVAAPTAGLHFTPALLDEITARGIERIETVLHVGPGTFKPVTAERLDEHDMHEEAYRVPAASRPPLARRVSADPPGSAGRVIAVGTTAVRVLESISCEQLAAGVDVGDLVGRTDLLIAPPYRFKHVHGLLTNFHLPRSTLLALVAAMVGLDRLHELYREAIDRRYRFYSYGDAMLILP